MLIFLVACATDGSSVPPTETGDSAPPERTCTCDEVCGVPICPSCGGCDDSNANVGPYCPELCNGMDDNCDGAVDEDVTNTYYQDADGDGWGDDTVTTADCDAPSGYVANAGDCDDTDDTVHPDDVGVCDPGCDSTCDCAGADELCYEGTCRVAGPALAAYRATLDRVVAAMDPTTGEFAEENAYPSETLMTLASGADLLCDADLARAAETRATYARAAETADHYYVQPGFGSILRDYQARHIYNLWAAGHALGDPTLLAAADDAALAMLALERVEYKAGFTLFCVSYSANPGHACDNGVTTIDVNQNSEIGLAFALLANDPESALYGDPDALDVVAQELGAAISLQDAASGAIPLGSEGPYPTWYDTEYGSYAAWSWTNSADPLVTDPVALAATWLAPYSDGSPESHRYYPYPYDGDISLSEGAMRLPLLSHTGTLDPGFVDYFWTVTVPADTETETVWMPFWIPLHTIDMPLADLIPPA